MLKILACFNDQLCVTMLIVNMEGKMISLERKQQLRDAQRRRRNKLAEGTRGQVNIYLTQQCKVIVDTFCDDYKTDKHAFINALIIAFANSPGALKLDFNK